MNRNDLTGLPIVDNNKKLVGLVTLKELAKDLIQGNFTRLRTSYKNIVETLNGEEILKFDEEIEGNIMAAAFRSATFIQNIKVNQDDILIVGDRNNILEYVITSKVKLIILVGDGELSQHNFELAKLNKVNIIKTKYDTYRTTKLINLSNYIETVAASNPTVIQNVDYYTYFKEIIDKTKHTNYPVVNKKGECLGLFPITLTGLKNRKKVILVDHNEKTQSVDGLEEADIVEVVDHHKLGTLATAIPINFRNMAVGSTNTIIYNLFKESNVEIPQNIAGIMLSGILSDTLLLKSPTTTELDKEVVNHLEKMSDSLEGKQKIIRTLVKKGLPYEMVKEGVDSYSDASERTKAIRYIKKNEKLMKEGSVKMKKQMLISRLINHGYSFDIAKDVVNNYEFTDDFLNDTDSLYKAIQKAIRTYSRKYSGQDLKRMVLNQLIRKGFSSDDVLMAIEEMEIFKDEN